MLTCLNCKTYLTEFVELTFGMCETCVAAFRIAPDINTVLGHIKCYSAFYTRYSKDYTWKVTSVSNNIAVLEDNDGRKESWDLVSIKKIDEKYARPTT